MIVAVITLAIALAGALGTTGYLAYRLVAGLKSERASFAAETIATKALTATEVAQRAAEKERDEALAAQAKAEAERDAANARLAETQTALNKAREEKARDAALKIRCAPDLDAAVGELEQLFATVPRGATTAAVPAGDDRSEP